MNTKYGKINKVPYFKYLEEYIVPTGLERSSTKSKKKPLCQSKRYTTKNQCEDRLKFVTIIQS